MILIFRMGNSNFIHLEYDDCKLIEIEDNEFYWFCNENKTKVQVQIQPIKKKDMLNNNLLIKMLRERNDSYDGLLLHYHISYSGMWQKDIYVQNCRY